MGPRSSATKSSGPDEIGIDSGLGLERVLLVPRVAQVPEPGRQELRTVDGMQREGRRIGRRRLGLSETEHLLQIRLGHLAGREEEELEIGCLDPQAIGEPEPFGLSRAPDDAEFGIRRAQIREQAEVGSLGVGRHLVGVRGIPTQHLDGDANLRDERRSSVSSGREAVEGLVERRGHGRGVDVGTRRPDQPVLGVGEQVGGGRPETTTLAA